MKNILTIIFAILVLVTETYAQKELTLQPDSEKGKDAWIWSFERFKEIGFGSESEQNYGLNNVIRAEVWKWSRKETPDTIRGLLQFNLSEIPNTASILEAKLSLYFYANEGFTPQLGDNELLIQRITENWEEDKVNWVNQPSATEHNQIELPKSENVSQDYLNIDVRNIVQEMVYFPEKNNGFLIKLKKEQEFNGLTFASSDFPDEKKRPLLYIKYLSNE